ncbi:hypothetical protein C5S32_07955 [ANME-1 cluster archaeon GoMg1]|nr:hypothetical protein [ANME-1 cluster archaeon GoMg1]
MEKHGCHKSCYIEKYLLKMPSNRIWIDYDEDADVLYISFQKPQHADDSEMKDNIIYHYRGKDLVGVTVVGAKKYGNSSNFSSL